MGINTVDSFDIHTGIVDLRRTLDAAAKEHKAVSIISAGWDPGSDSIVRTMLEAIAPKGITYTNFGPGMSMGHTVAVKAIDGVKAALSMTIPTGTGIHRRMVYIELKDGYKFEEVAAAIKADPYFVNDETHVKLVPSVDALLDMGHGVNLTRKGVSGKTQNQLFESEMAFIMAAKLAYKAAMPEAGPVILEPIHTLKAHVPNDNTGDIMGDVTKRRGRVLGMEPDEDGMQTVIAEVPLAELSNFTTFIRQITQGRGWFTTEFARYEILPEMLVPAVVEQAKKLGNLDEGAED